MRTCQVIVNPYPVILSAEMVLLHLEQGQTASLAIDAREAAVPG